MIFSNPLLKKTVRALYYYSLSLADFAQMDMAWPFIAKGLLSSNLARRLSLAILFKLALSSPPVPSTPFFLLYHIYLHYIYHQAMYEVSFIYHLSPSTQI